MMKNFYRIKNTDLLNLGELDDHGVELVEMEHMYSLVRMTDESARALEAIGCPVVRC
jgi:hypothetical protein